MIWCLQKEIKHCLTWKLHGLSYIFLTEFYDFNTFMSNFFLTSSKPSYFIIQSFLNLYLLQWFFPTIFAAPWLWILFKQLVHFKTASATSIWGKRVSFFCVTGLWSTYYQFLGQKYSLWVRCMWYVSYCSILLLPIYLLAKCTMGLIPC